MFGKRKKDDFEEEFELEQPTNEFEETEGNVSVEEMQAEQQYDEVQPETQYEEPIEDMQYEEPQEEVTYEEPQGDVQYAETQEEQQYDEPQYDESQYIEQQYDETQANVQYAEMTESTPFDSVQTEPQYNGYNTGNQFEEYDEDNAPIMVEIADEEPITLDDIDEEALFVMGAEFDVDEGVILIENEENFAGLVDKDGMFEIETKKKDAAGNKIKKKVRVKKKHNYTIGELRDENYGTLLPFIQDVNVTDINWNGKQLWIDDITKGRYLSEVVLDKDFVDTFSVRVSNVVSKGFNKYSARLEAETEELRITIIHESVSHTGTAISIRKTPALKRINFIDNIRNGEYCSVEVANIMSNCVKAKFNIVIVGLPGVGKTELVKFLTNYIRDYDRVITVEDTLELHYSIINPQKDVLEFKVNDTTFTYTDAIKASLRLLPQWVLLSEARSVEVKYLLESISTGTKCITTLHTDDVRSIPERVINMMGSVENRKSVENNIYSFFNIGILLDKKLDEKTGKITRWISQLCYFDRTSEGENTCTMLVEDGQLTGNTFNDNYMKKFNKIGIVDPFKYTYLD